MKRLFNFMQGLSPEQKLPFLRPPPKAMAAGG